MQALFLLPFLGLLAIGTNAVTVSFHNRCEKDIALNELDPDTLEIMGYDMIPKKQTLCKYVIRSWHHYRFGTFGKSHVLVRRNILKSFYELDNTRGFDFPIQVWATTGDTYEDNSMIECEAEGCPNAVWTVEDLESGKKMKKTVGDTVHINLCADKEPGNAICGPSDYVNSNDNDYY